MANITKLERLASRIYWINQQIRALPIGGPTPEWRAQGMTRAQRIAHGWLIMLGGYGFARFIDMLYCRPHVLDMFGWCAH